MTDATTNIILAIVSALGGGTLTVVAQAVLNRRRNRAETVRVSAETLSIDVENRRAIEDFYAGLLGKREDLAEKIYGRLIDLETKFAKEQAVRIQVEAERDKYLRQLHAAGLAPLIESDESNAE